MALSLVSVNVEWDKHLATVLPFLKAQKADVVCIQELLQRDIPAFEEACGPCIGYGPTGMKDINGGISVLGNGIFSRVRGTQSENVYYVGPLEPLKLDDDSSDIETHVLVVADIDGYRIATTNFTWSPNGEPNDDQRRDLVPLFHKLDGLGEFVLVGDFNAPRGKVIFTALTERYKDNIPPEHETSIDLKLHKTHTNPVENARVAKFMVDGLFTTPGYEASNVSLQFGVSDHAAIVATITKTA